MTTAHRPTWNSARGGTEQGGNLLINPTRQFSALDTSSHKVLKQRQPGQGAKQEQTIDFKQQLLKQEKREAKSLLFNKYQEDESDEEEPIEAQPYKRIKVSEIQDSKKATIENPFVEDADAKLSSSEDEEEENESQDEDELELMREYERVKKEKDEEQAKREAEKMEEIKQRQQEEVLRANPLLNQEDYSLKKKWHEETVFRNQMVGVQKDRKRFINDTVRSDFHKKFLSRFVQ